MLGSQTHRTTTKGFRDIEYTNYHLNIHHIISLFSKPHIF